MKGILFKEDMFFSVIQETKTQTRRIAISGKPRFVVGEKVFLKEPYLLLENKVYYKFDCDFIAMGKGWKNKMFMPEKYARYFIEITHIKKEPLLEITEDDAIAEGIEKGFLNHGQKVIYKDYTDKKNCWENPIDSYRTLWESINGKRSWRVDPEVWVYEFKLVK